MVPTLVRMKEQKYVGQGCRVSGGLTERNWVMTTVCARSFEVALGHTLDVLVPGPIMSMIEKVGGLAEQGLGMDLDGSGSKGDFAFEGAVVNGVASIGGRIFKKVESGKLEEAEFDASTMVMREIETEMGLANGMVAHICYGTPLPEEEEEEEAEPEPEPVQRLVCKLDTVDSTWDELSEAQKQALAVLGIATEEEWKSDGSEPAQEPPEAVPPTEEELRQQKEEREALEIKVASALAKRLGLKLGTKAKTFAQSGEGWTKTKGLYCYREGERWYRSSSSSSRVYVCITCCAH
eukprot:COSAG01_NODE_4374_length_5087_cov_2.572374_6_plen_293_part_00